jgi:hypothetical protein
MRADKIAIRQPVRMLIVGYPGTAKTGMIASLANVGYKIRMLDYDGNSQSLLEYTDKDKLANIDIVYLEDKMRNGDRFIETTGIPTAFRAGLDLMDEWKYTEPNGTEVNLGKSKDWGCDTIVVLDSMGSMGDASMLRQMALSNKTPLNNTDGVWGLAMNQQEAFIKRLTSENNNFHIIVLSHLKMIGPRDTRKGEDDLTKDLKERIAALVDTRLFPSALGHVLPPVIGGHFPVLLEASNEFDARGVQKQVIRIQSRPELDLKLPSKNRLSFDKASITDGLAKIFAELAPPLETCREKAGVLDAKTEEKKV